MKRCSLTVDSRQTLFLRTNRLPVLPLFPALAGIVLGLGMAQAADNRAPSVPPTLAVPVGHKVSFQVYATGVQIYVWTQSPTDPTQFSWVFKAPEAMLYDFDQNIVGTHYGGPTWESNSGSTVVGARIAGTNVSPTSIPWLLLSANSTQGPGIFERTTFIHRVNTTGGLAPSTPGSTAGEEARVPYTADYYFYRAK